MRRRIALLLAFLLALTGCGPAAAPARTDGMLRIVTTTFAAYDWTRAVLGDELPRAELVWLGSGGVDFHSYEPTVADLAAIADSDLVIYVGGPSDDWVGDALAGDTRAIDLLNTLGGAARLEETVEGMEAEEEDDAEFDEHVWLSLRNASRFVNAIAEALGQLEPDRAAAYLANAAAYDEQLSALDEAYRQAAAQAALQADRQHTVLLFADRFPFRYLFDDYSLSYYAAFPGCSAETEASFETVAFLARKADQLRLPCVLVIDGSDARLAETVVANTGDKNQKILTLDSMQSVTLAGAADTTYLAVMAKNLEVLKEAMG